MKDVGFLHLPPLPSKIYTSGLPKPKWLLEPQPSQIDFKYEARGRVKTMNHLLFKDHPLRLCFNDQNSHA